MGREPSVPSTLTNRQRELALLRAGLDAAVVGRGHLYFLSGVPGVGKTRLLEETAALATQRNVTVLWSRCVERDVAFAFAPWVQILRPLIQNPGAMDRYVLSQVASIVANEAAATAFSRAAPGPERCGLMDAIASFLRAVAETQPLVLLFDDLQWASLPSLLLLELLARELGRTPMLVVAAYRETGTAMIGYLGGRPGDLARHSTSILLRELDAAGTHALTAGLIGRAPSARFAALLHEATGGNPFFLDQLVRRLVADGCCDESSLTAGPMMVPDPVRDAVRAWLACLTPKTRAVLKTATVVGQEFEAELVAMACAMSMPETLTALSAAGTAGLVQQTTIGVFRFRHGLTRETIAADLPRERRRALHDAVGIALETRHAGRLDVVLPALAHHFTEGLHELNRARALTYLRRAGEQALDRHDYERAVAHFEESLRVLVPDAGATKSTLAELQLLLARAALRAGDVERAKQAAREAATEARRLSSGALLAQAALTFRRADSPYADAELLALLEEARTALGASNSALRARLDAQLARELARGAQLERSDALSRSAVAVARGLDDIPTLAVTLARRCRTLGDPLRDEERLALSGELLDYARRLGDRELDLDARHSRVADFLAIADVAALDDEITAVRRGSERIRQPYYLWWSRLWRSMRANLSGDFARGKRLAAEAHAIGSRVRPRTARIALTVQTIVRLWQQGKVVRLLTLVEGFAAEHGDFYPECRAGRIWALASGERRGDASRGLASLAAADFSGVPFTPTSGIVVALLAETAAMLGDTAYAPQLYERLRPYAGRVVALGPALECFGPADRYLGILATLGQQWDSAEAHFSRSLELSRRLAAPPFVARTLQNHGAMLCTRGRREDYARAEAMLAEALAAAQRFGMAKVAQEAREAQVRLAETTAESASSAYVRADEPSLTCGARPLDVPLDRLPHS